VERTLTLVALAAPPVPLEASRGAVSSRAHMVSTAVSGRSWLIREQMNLVSTTVMTRPQAIVKKPNPKPMARWMLNTMKKTRMPTPHATYRARHGKVAFGGPSQTASTRYTSSSVRTCTSDHRTRSAVEQAGEPGADVYTRTGDRDADDGQRDEDATDPAHDTSVVTLATAQVQQQQRHHEQQQGNDVVDDPLAEATRAETCGGSGEVVDDRHLVLLDATSSFTRRIDSRSASDVTADEYTMSI
jgi:hypothetical protein